MKDYKPRPKAKRSGSVGNTLIGIFIGLLLGLLIAAAIAIYMSKAPFPFSQQKPKPQPDRPLAQAPAPGGGANSGTKPDAKSGSTTTANGERRFDFYNILPGKEEPTPRPSNNGEASRPDTAKAPVLKESFVLQVGSFQNPAEADQRKARLALLGLEANVEPVELPDKGTWYRVRLGPFKSLSEVNHVRSQLAQNGVEAQLVKSKEP